MIGQLARNRYVFNARFKNFRTLIAVGGPLPSALNVMVNVSSVGSMMLVTLFTGSSSHSAIPARLMTDRQISKTVKVKPMVVVRLQLRVPRAEVGPPG